MLVACRRELVFVHVRGCDATRNMLIVDSPRCLAPLQTVQAQHIEYMTCATCIRASTLPPFVASPSGLSRCAWAPATINASFNSLRPAHAQAKGHRTQVTSRSCIITADHDQARAAMHVHICIALDRGAACRRHVRTTVRTFWALVGSFKQVLSASRHRPLCKSCDMLSAIASSASCERDG